MGVTGLWGLLKKHGCVVPSHGPVQEQRLAIDISLWMCHATKQQAFHQDKFDLTDEESILRVVFDRVVHMLRLGIKPVAVLDGKPPAAKQRALEARFKARNLETIGLEPDVLPNHFQGAGNARFQHLCGRVRALLRCLGVPCISEDQVEAETICAEMQNTGLVDAVATEDGDCLLFGARCVLRNFRADGNAGTVSCDRVCMDQVKQVLGFGRNGLVAIAFLLGCDYTDGLKGVNRFEALGLVQSLVKQEGHADSVLSALRTLIESAGKGPADGKHQRFLTKVALHGLDAALAQLKTVEDAFNVSSKNNPRPVRLPSLEHLEGVWNFGPVDAAHPHFFALGLRIPRAGGDKSFEDALRRRLLPLELEKVVRALSDFPSFGQKGWSAQKSQEGISWASARGLRHVPMHIKRAWKCKNSQHVAGWWVEWLGVRPSDNNVHHLSICAQVRAGLLEEHCPRLVEDFHRSKTSTAEKSRSVKRKISQTHLEAPVGRQRTLSTSFSFINNRVRKTLSIYRQSIVRKSVRRRSIASTTGRKSICVRSRNAVPPLQSSSNDSPRRRRSRIIPPSSPTNTPDAKTRARLDSSSIDVSNSRLQQEVQQERLQSASTITESSFGSDLSPLCNRQHALTSAFSVVKKIRTSVPTPWTSAKEKVVSQQPRQTSGSSDLPCPCRAVFSPVNLHVVDGNVPICAVTSDRVANACAGVGSANAVNAGDDGFQAGVHSLAVIDRHDDQVSLPVWKAGILQMDPKDVKAVNPKEAQVETNLQFPGPLKVGPLNARWDGTSVRFSNLVLSPPVITPTHELLCSDLAIFNNGLLKPKEGGCNVSRHSDENDRFDNRSEYPSAHYCQQLLRSGSSGGAGVKSITLRKAARRHSDSSHNGSPRKVAKHTKDDNSALVRGAIKESKREATDPCAPKEHGDEPGGFLAADLTADNDVVWLT